MDLERIKQNLRLRSGRFTKQSKKQNNRSLTGADPSSHSGQIRPQSSIEYVAAQVATRSQSSTARMNAQVPLRPQTSVVQPKSGATSRPQSSHGLNVQSPPTPEQTVNTERKISRSKTRDNEKGGKQIQRLHSERSQPNGSADLTNVFSHTVKDRELEDPDMHFPQSYADILSTHRDPSPRKRSRLLSDPSISQASPGSEAEDFDLRPPALKSKQPSMEHVSELLFSDGHLKTLLYDPSSLKKFAAFLQKYRPNDHPLLLSYLEASKALKAIEYANAVGGAAPALSQHVSGNEAEMSNAAAVVNTSLQNTCISAFETLLNTCLPLYVTFTLIQSLSECLVDEVTGRISSAMTNMAGGLAKVFCLSDPNQEDNPIVYASEGFYRLTGYEQDDVIGRNCRFLQGQRTSRSSTKRIRERLDKGEEVCETLLNYRRDGKPFLNVLMIAPLYDDKGKVRYHIGAQVDVSRLIDTGKVLEGFQTYVSERENAKALEFEEKDKRIDPVKLKRQKALTALRELSELFDLEESAVVGSHSRTLSVERDERSKLSVDGTANPRRRLADVEAFTDEDDRASVTTPAGRKLAPSRASELSGKLPGIYEKYMLIRPYPSLRIVFISSKLRKFGNVDQSPFMSHVAAPASTISGLAESFKIGVPVSAKINFMSRRSAERDGTKTPSNERHEDGKYGRACWLSATPLQGGDSQIGVWMIVFIEKAQAKAQWARSRLPQLVNTEHQRARPERNHRQNSGASVKLDQESSTTAPKAEHQRSDTSAIKPNKLDDLPHSLAHRQDSQRSSAGYQCQAEMPIGEYHSADEEGETSSPNVPTPRGDMPPQTHTYDVTDVVGVIASRAVDPRNPSQDRICITPDSNHDAELQSDVLQNWDFDAIPRGFEKSDYQDPNEIPPSLPSEHRSDMGDLQSNDDDAAAHVKSVSPVTDSPFSLNLMETTRQPDSMSARSPPRLDLPARGVSPENSQQEKLKLHTPPPESPEPTLLKISSPYSSQGPTFESPPMTDHSYKSHTSRSSTVLSAGLGYMDYLRHSSRQMSGDGQREFTRSRDENGSDPWSEDGDCKSPYSVD